MLGLSDEFCAWLGRWEYGQEHKVSAPLPGQYCTDSGNKKHFQIDELQQHDQSRRKQTAECILADSANLKDFFHDVTILFCSIACYSMSIFSPSCTVNVFLSSGHVYSKWSVRLLSIVHQWNLICIICQRFQTAIYLFFVKLMIFLCYLFAIKVLQGGGQSQLSWNLYGIFFYIVNPKLKWISLIHLLFFEGVSILWVWILEAQKVWPEIWYRYQPLLNISRP